MTRHPLLDKGCPQIPSRHPLNKQDVPWRPQGSSVCWTLPLPREVGSLRTGVKASGGTSQAFPKSLVSLSLPGGVFPDPILAPSYTATLGCCPSVTLKTVPLEGDTSLGGGAGSDAAPGQRRAVLWLVLLWSVFR